jgi:ABC-type antimicrobial peptide transport system permease subunit
MRLFVVESVLLGFVAAVVGGLIGVISAVQPYTEMSLSWGIVWVFIAFDLGMVVLMGTFAYARTRAHITAGVLIASALPVLGIVAQISIVSSFPLGFLLTTGILGACLVFILIVSLLGSVFPASLAARLYPVEALR